MPAGNPSSDGACGIGDELNVFQNSTVSPTPADRQWSRHAASALPVYVVSSARVGAAQSTASSAARVASP
jgi:hypothetical protein